MKFKLIDEIKQEVLKKLIQDCQKENHVQQVAFSTYHNALTQICFTCGKVRTSMKEDDYIIFQDKSKEEKNK